MRIADAQGDGLPHLIQGWTDSEDNSHYGAWANNNSYRADIFDEHHLSARR